MNNPVSGVRWRWMSSASVSWLQFQMLLGLIHRPMYEPTRIDWLHLENRLEKHHRPTGDPRLNPWALPVVWDYPTLDFAANDNSSNTTTTTTTANNNNNNNNNQRKTETKHQKKESCLLCFRLQAPGNTSFGIGALQVTRRWLVAVRDVEIRSNEFVVKG